MNMYNMMHGVKMSTFFVLPMLGLHPNDIPRFRDCFMADDEHPEHNGKILVYTRVGGGNRNCGFGEEKLMAMPDFVATYDDSFDQTYGMYVFNVPKKWREDFDKIYNPETFGIEPKGLVETSPAYKQELKKVYPTLADKMDALFAEIEIAVKEQKAKKDEKNEVEK